MGDFKYIQGLKVTVGNHKALITIQNPREVMALDPDLDVLCVPIKKNIEPSKDQPSVKPRPNLNQDIGTASNPVQLEERIEGFKCDGKWTYRNCTPRKKGFCTMWFTSTDLAMNAKFDKLYLEFIAGEESHGNKR